MWYVSEFKVTDIWMEGLVKQDVCSVVNHGICSQKAGYVTPSVFSTLFGCIFFHLHLTGRSKASTQLLQPIGYIFMCCLYICSQMESFVNNFIFNTGENVRQKCISFKILKRVNFSVLIWEVTRYVSSSEATIAWSQRLHGEFSISSCTFYSWT